MVHDEYSGGGHRCVRCGRFATCRYEWRGPSYCEVTYCRACDRDESGSTEPREGSDAQ
jgi:hypothetical protein